MKKTIRSLFAIFITFSILDFVIHGLILGSTYSTFPQLFLPIAEMKLPLVYFVTLVTSFVFVYLYLNYVSEKNFQRALGYGCWLGLGYGFGMGYGTYAFMPIPPSIAFTWFLGTWAEFMIAGAVLGWIEKKGN